jgi:hypothetical protein
LDFQTLAVEIHIGTSEGVVAEFPRYCWEESKKRKKDIFKNCMPAEA